MGKAVQFTQIDDVLSAYESQAIPMFAVFSDRQLLFKWQDDDLSGGLSYLDDMLEKLKSSKSFAVYTLCVYDGVPGGKIKNNTPYDASINFQLNEGSIAKIGAVPGGQLFTQYQVDLAVENALLKAKLAEFETDDNMQPAKESEMAGVIGKVLEIPGVPDLIGAISTALGDIITGMVKRPAQVAQVEQYSGVGEVRRVSGIENLRDYESMEKSLNYLCSVLPDVPDLLNRLCLMHKQNPLQFKLTLAGLRGMKFKNTAL